MSLVGSLREYRGFTGTIEYDADKRMYHGKLENVYDDIFYQARTPADLYEQFKEAVDWYLNSGLIH